MHRPGNVPIGGGCGRNEVEHMGQPLVEVELSGARLPAYARTGDAGADLSLVEDLELAPGERALVGTGIAVAIPSGYAGFVHPRSGLAARAGVTLVNAPGTIDCGFRGEIKLNLINLDPITPAVLYRGDRVAQLVIMPVSTAIFRECTDLPDSERGTRGHGSTGGFGDPTTRAATRPAPEDRPASDQRS